MALLTYSSTIPFSSSSSPSSLSSRRFPATPFRTHVSGPLNPWRFRSRLPRLHAPTRAKATLTVDSPATGDASSRNGPPRVLLEVKDLKAVIKESGQEILRGVNLTIHGGEVGRSPFLPRHPPICLLVWVLVYWLKEFLVRFTRLWGRMDPERARFQRWPWCLSQLLLLFSYKLFISYRNILI